jgi:hypothetical protein
VQRIVDHFPERFAELDDFSVLFDDLVYFLEKDKRFGDGKIHVLERVCEFLGCWRLFDKSDFSACNRVDDFVVAFDFFVAHFVVYYENQKEKKKKMEKK